MVDSRSAPQSAISQVYVRVNDATVTLARFPTRDQVGGTRYQWEQVSLKAS